MGKSTSAGFYRFHNVGDIIGSNFVIGQKTGRSLGLTGVDG